MTLIKARDTEFTITDMLERLVCVAPALINQFVKPGPHCVLATTVGQMALTRLGIPADPYVVELAITNQAWTQWRDDKFPGGIEEQQRRGAYLLTNTPNWKGQSFTKVKIAKPWDGHLVLRVPDGDRQWLVDLDLGSFNRPQHNILVPMGLVAPLTTEGIVIGTFTAGQTQTTVEYAPLIASYRDDYITSRDWVERDRFEPHVDELMTVLLRHWGCA